MNAIQLIDETVSAYAADPPALRSRDNLGTCMYVTNDGRKCAIGRCLNKKFVHQAARHNFEHILSQVKARYKGFSQQFWRDLQELHDNNKNWDKNGLTEYGQTEVRYMKGTYK